LIVELVFNLLWLTLSLGLVLFWTMIQHPSANETLRCSTRMQIVALAMLIVILLPVVSLTDDLQTCTAPAEAEHLGRRVDMHINADTCLHAASIVAAAHLAVEQALRLQTLAYLRPAMATKAPSAGYLRIAGSRPPPFA
jgi:hypothetical protein